MRKIKKAILVIAVLSLVTMIAHATVSSRTAELLYDDIKILLDGKELVPKDANGNVVEAFIIDGTTYLPVRGISSALGLNVSWNDETKSVQLDTPGVFPGAVQVYDDENVTIDFAGCTSKDMGMKDTDGNDIIYYYANFNVKNKTDVELIIGASTLSFNGISYNGFIGGVGASNVAPRSTGKISFLTMKNALPTSGINKTSGKVSVMDSSKSFLKESYEAKWVDVTN